MGEMLILYSEEETTLISEDTEENLNKLASKFGNIRIHPNGQQYSSTIYLDFHFPVKALALHLTLSSCV